MKRVEKIRINSFLLNKKELKELKGGGNVYNTNGDSGCMCNYKNHSAIINDNSSMGCKCVCSQW